MQKAREHPTPRCDHLYERLTDASLHEGWGDIRQDAAAGIDQVSAEAYEPPREENRHARVERLQGKRDRATRVQRPSIPTGDGQRRPCGLPAVEAKRRQRAVVRLLEAIDAPDFRRCRDGDRPTGGALDAVDKRTITLQGGRYHVVGEADIKGCCDNMQHDGLSRRWAERLEDGAVLRLMRTWLTAGGLDTDGQGLPPVTGTPHGGVMSPSLAHVYLHDALDLWVQQVVKPRCGGEAGLMRYAADVVAAVQ